MKLKLREKVIQLAQAIVYQNAAHHGSDADNAECNETCGRDFKFGDCDHHRPDIEQDRCDKGLEDDCMRCLGLNTLKELKVKPRE